MKKLRILVDIDSVAADTLPYWLDRIATDTGVRAQISDITLWDMAKCPPLTTLAPKQIFGVLQAEGFIRNVPPMPGVATALKRLMDQGHEIYLVTARHGPVSMPATIEWMKEHLPFMNPEKQLIFAYDKNLLQADIIIDDKAETLEKYLAAHPRSLAYKVNYPYNETLKHDRLGAVSYDGCWERLTTALELTAEAIDLVGEENFWALTA